MNNKSRKLPTITLSIAVICILILLYYFVFFKQKQVTLAWVDVAYTQCLETSSDQLSEVVFLDLQDVHHGEYSGEKLREYSKNIKPYLKGICKEDTHMHCEGSFLYVLRSHLARGNEKDFKIAFSMLDQYKKLQGPNLYYDSSLLDVAYKYATKEKVDDKYYEGVLNQVQSHALTESYFDKPHQVQMCNSYLSKISKTFSKSGDYSADLYIQYHIKH